MNRIEAADRLKRPVTRLVRSRWNQPPFRSMAGVAQRYLRMWENADHTLGTNGEAALLRHLAPSGLSTLIDVGCHVGAWTDAALAAVPGATIHAFEADPYLAQRLREKYNDDARVVINATGLADVSGVIPLHVDPEHRDISSMIATATNMGNEIEVPVQRGADYAQLCGLETIDFLKIDTEGFDWTVLAGFGELIGPQIHAIQFEYNTWNIRSRHLLADFYALLEPQGYRLGKVHPNGVAFAPYTPAQENWIGPAVLAVHESANGFVDACGV